MTELRHEFTAKLAAPVTRVFAALSEAAGLEEWFAEHVQVEPRVGGAFRFWGRHTYGAPTHAQATQRLTRYAPARELAFTWTLHDCATEVTYMLATDPEAPNGTVLTGTHIFERTPVMARAQSMVDDLWRLNMGNLQAHLAGGAGVILPDYTDDSPTIRTSITIDAPRERVFRALLDPALLNQWIATVAEVEPRAGGRYVYGWKRDQDGSPMGPTRILELIDNEKLVIDWPDWRGEAGVPVQRVTWLLETVAKQTRLTLIHEGFARTVDFSDYPFGWGWFLSCLERAVLGESPKD